jgi:WhiB family redox-sensing transcriptional regulator
VTTFAPLVFAPDTTQPDHGWRAYALCAQTDPALFYPEEGQSTAPARAVCMGCEVRRECLAYALEREPLGVWGGLSQGQRKAMKRRRRTTENGAR